MKIPSYCLSKVAASKQAPTVALPLPIFSPTQSYTLARTLASFSPFSVTAFVTLYNYRKTLIRSLDSTLTITITLSLETSLSLSRFAPPWRIASTSSPRLCCRFPASFCRSCAPTTPSGQVSTPSTPFSGAASSLPAMEPCASSPGPTRRFRRFLLSPTQSLPPLDLCQVLIFLHVVSLGCVSLLSRDFACAILVVALASCFN